MYTYPCTSASATGFFASVPSEWLTESNESFQPWLYIPELDFTEYDVKPLLSMSA